METQGRRGYVAGGIVVGDLVMGTDAVVVRLPVEIA